MELSFPWPASQGEWMASAVAAVTILIGLLSLFAPRLRLRLHGLALADGRPLGLAAMRGPLAGFPLGVGVASVLLAQPFVYLTLGLCWAFAALGRLISILSDRGGSPVNWAMLLIELVLALLPLAFVFAVVP